MVVGVPKETILREWQALDPNLENPREGGLKGHPLFWEIGAVLLRRYLHLDPKHLQTFTKLASCENRPGGGVPFPQQGRGILLLINASRLRHAVAYEHGMVFDSHNPGPMTYEEWQANVTWNIEAVFPANEQAESEKRS